MIVFHIKLHPGWHMVIFLVPKNSPTHFATIPQCTKKQKIIISTQESVKQVHTKYTYGEVRYL